MEQIVTKNLSLDVARPNTGQMVIAKQYDVDSRYLKVTLKNEGVDVAIAPSSQVVINAIRKDGSKKSFLGVVNEDGTATVPVTPWMLEEDGKVNCDVTIVDTAGRRLSSTLFLINVEISAFGSGDITDDPNYNVLIQLLAEVSQSKEAELARVAAETDRAAAETARLTAETTRIEAEAARATAEINRASAETERIEAEVLRQEEYAKMVPATESANTAANSANAAAASANDVVNQIDTLLSQHADQPYQTASGESLHIDDSAGGWAKKIEFCGNARQGSNPTPTGPQKIDVVKGPITGKICGKNLFTGLVMGKGLNETTGAVKDSSISATSDYIAIDISKTYFLSGLSTKLKSSVFAYNIDKNYIGCITPYAFAGIAIMQSVFNNLQTGADTSQIKYIRITTYEASTIEGSIISAIDNAKIQLEQGNAATAYEPHAMTIGENLFTGLTKGIMLNSTNNTTYPLATAATSDYIEIDISKSYFLSGVLSTLYSAVNAYSANKSFVGRVGTTSRTSCIINKNAFEYGQTGIDLSLIKYIRIAQCENVATTGKINDIYNANIQFAQCVIPHEFSIPLMDADGNAIELCKVKNVPDKITCKDGLWGVDKPAQKITLDGTNALDTAIANNNRYFRCKLIKPANTTIPTSADLMCTHYKATGGSVDGYCYIAAYGTWLYMYDNRFTTVADCQAWHATELAAGHPVIAYYLLNEPERIILCDEAQTALNALAAASLPAGTVNMMTTNDPAPGIELEYRQDLKAFIVKVINETLAVQ